MKLAILSDVHGNLEALAAVRGLLESESPDETWFLGDAVGYGPDPEECLHIVRELCDVVLLGNHDAAVVGLTDPSCFNIYARMAVEYTEMVLSEESKSYLARLPLRVDRRGACLVHGSPFRPADWHYLFSDADARLAFESFDGSLCFVGHSHRPEMTVMDRDGTMAWAQVVHSSGLPAPGAGERRIVNVGSVGQPRDGDPRAAVAFWEEKSGEVRLERVSYDVESVQRKMMERALPEYLAERLSRGL